MRRLSWNTELCSACNIMQNDRSARPPYLDRERHEHPVFQDTGQGASHALARELWKYAMMLEGKQLRLEHEIALLQRMVMKVELPSPPE